MSNILPPIGWNVLFYTNADPDSEPEAGLVTAVATNGVLCITTFPSTGGARARKSVLHISSGKFQEKPNLRKNGAWDFIAGHTPPAAADPLLYEKCRKLLVVDGFTPAEIAQKLQISQKLVKDTVPDEIAQIEAVAKENEELKRQTAKAK